MAVTIVQSQTLVQGTAATTHPITFTSATTAGCAVLVVCQMAGSIGGTQTVTVSDNNGGVYLAIGICDGQAQANPGGKVCAFIASNLAGRSGHIVTLAHSGSAAWCTAKIYELGGVPTSSLITGVPVVEMIPYPVSAPTFSDVVPDHAGLIFAALAYYGSPTTITPNWAGATQDAELDEPSAIAGPLSILTKTAVAGTKENPSWALGTINSSACVAFAIRNSGTTPLTTGVLIRQTNIAIRAATSTSVDISFPNPTTAGSAILVIGMADINPPAPAITVSDNNGSTYTGIINQDNSGGSWRVGAFIAANITGRSGHIVTATFDKAAYSAIKIYELTRVPTSSPTTGTAVSFTSSSTAISPGSFTPADNGLQFAAALFTQAGRTATPNWAGGLQDAEIDEADQISGPLLVLRKNVSASVAQTPAWTLSASDTWAAISFAIKETPSVTLLTNCVAYWKLDELNGNRLDSSGLGSTLNESSVTINSRSGKVGSAAAINRGNLSVLRCASNANLSMGDVDFTIACWANADDFFVGSSTCVCKDNTTNYEYDVYFDDLGKISFYLDRSGGANASVVWGSSSVTGTWYFIVAIHDSVNDLIKLSVNNGAFVTAAFSGGPSALPTAPLAIGSESALRANSLLNGSVDEVGIWKRCLSQTDVTALYNGGAGLTYPFTVGPVDYTARNKRASVIGLDGLYRMVLPVPDSTIDATDRWQITGKRRMVGAPPAIKIFRNRTASRMRFPTLA